MGDTNDLSRLDDIRNDLNWYYHRLELEQNPKENLAPVRIRELYAKIAVRENEFLQLIRESEPDNSGNTAFPAAHALSLSEVRSFLAQI